MCSVAKLTAFGQQDQLCCRIALACECDRQARPASARRRNRRQCSNEIPLRRLDALPDGDFLVRLQQPALADVLQVQAHEVDVFAGRRLLGLLDFFLFLRLVTVLSSTASGWSTNASGSSSRSRRSGETLNGRLLSAVLPFVHVEAEIRARAVASRGRGRVWTDPPIRSATCAAALCGRKR